MAEFIKDYSIVARMRQISAGQGAIFDYPAYIVVYLLHVLARDTGFPSEGCQDEQMYADLCSPLFFFMQALVKSSIVDGDLDLVNDAVLCLFSILRAIRKAEDAVDVQMTTKLHMLADIGIFFLNASKHGSISASQTPGQILLPSSLYGTSSAKNYANSKKSYFDECFLSRVLQKLKSSVPQVNVQKPAKNLKHGPKCQEDAPKSSFSTNFVSNLASSKLDDLSRKATTLVKTVRPDVPSGKRRKCALSSAVSGSVGLHECSTIDKQQNIASKHCEITWERKRLSSSGSVNLMTDSHVSTRKSKRAAALLENTTVGCKSLVQPCKCPRTNLKDTCGSKYSFLLSDEISLIKLYESFPSVTDLGSTFTVVASYATFDDLLILEGSNCLLGFTVYMSIGPGNHSYLSSLRKTTATTGGGTSKDGTSLNQENGGKENRRGKSSGTSESVVNTKRKAVSPAVPCSYFQASRSRGKG
ncbi:sister chromatid cohesion protein PDS5-like protein A isoform X2 [Senna tora]|uniref:Sister chromatid cohesion protein PDS5-like protein A isoform X2 n=1 Tax=Senna tora TaxID=362788 RepID=A0A834WRQ7_9FABA|nr:sister chromatid cohesion protein PDS5-like protein A isoform X2 [Senna tora]